MSRSSARFVILLALAFNQPAAAEEAVDLSTQWIPAISLALDIHDIEAKTSFSSDSIPTLAMGVRSAAIQGSRRITVGIITTEGLVDSPVIWDRAGKLRLSARLVAQLPTTIEHNVFRRESTDLDFGAGVTTEQVYTLRLVGNWGLGLGMRWTTSIAGYDFSFRPSVEYLGQRIGWNGLSMISERDPVLDAVGFETLVFSASGTEYETYHAVGVRLAIDAELGKRGPIGVSIYAQFQTYRIVSETETTISVVNDIGSGVGRMTFEVDNWVTQGGVGIRLSWLP